MRIQKLKSFALMESRFRWLVEGLIPQGNWTYFVGPPGSGKSMLALQLVKALQEGERFLGLETKKVNCLYIQSDASEGEWQEQVRLIAPDSSAFTGYSLPTSWTNDKNEVEALRLVLAGKNPHMKGVGPFDFVVFDALRSLALGADSQIAVASKVLETLKYLCTSTVDDATTMHSTFMLIHHPTKETARGVNVGSGWGGFNSDCGVILTLASKMLAREKGRVLKNRQISLERDSDGLWYVEGEEKKTYPASTTEALEKLYPELR